MIVPFDCWSEANQQIQDHGGESSLIGVDLIKKNQVRRGVRPSQRLELEKQTQIEPAAEKRFIECTINRGRRSP